MEFKARTGPRETDLLIVDDDTTLREGLADLFRMEGWSAETASDGREAIALLRLGLRPRLIVLDLDMPVLDGWGFVRGIEAMPAVAETPIVVMSGIADEPAAPQRQRDGGFFRKPVNFDRLVETVRRYCG
jgi:two-component system chemotaxis response regulator CheY